MIFLFSVGLLLMGCGLNGAARADQPIVLLLHGGGENQGASWSAALAEYEAAGFRVYAPNLPHSGRTAGDTWKNADIIQALITANRWTSVIVDGHSLGGTLVYELIRVRRDPRIVKAITRDSSIQYDNVDIFRCLGLPDSCYSDVRKNILAAPLADVPVLSVSANGIARADVDCNKQRRLDHAAFVTDATVNAWAIQWAKGENPCAATSLPPPQPTPAPTCSWWAWWCSRSS